MKSRKEITVMIALTLSTLALMVPNTPAGGGCPTIECAVNAGLAKQSIPKESRVGTVVGVVSGDDRTIFYYGKVNRSPGAPKPTGTTLFAIGSITKTMTATLLALYDKRGLVHIPPGNPRVGGPATLLQEVLPPGYKLPCPRKAITLLDLADHYSGVPKNTTDPDPTVARLYKELIHCPGCNCFEKPPCSACNPPGSYEYSNYGYLILGHVLANVAHAQTWSELNYSQIMQPLGMTDTNVKEGYTPAQDFGGRAATGYQKNSRGKPFVPNVQGPHGEDSPAGGLWSTPNDMMRWLVYNVSPLAPDVPTAAKAELLSLLPALHYPRADGKNPGERIGLAWQIVPLEVNSSRKVIEKGGSVSGFRAYIGFEPALKKGVFVLFNYSVENSDVSPVGRTILLNLP